MKVGIVAVLLPAEPHFNSPLKRPDRLTFLPTSLFNKTEGFSRQQNLQSRNSCYSHLTQMLRMSRATLHAFLACVGTNL
jgi:hypothetical protein